MERVKRAIYCPVLFTAAFYIISLAVVCHDARLLESNLTAWRINDKRAVVIALILLLWAMSSRDWTFMDILTLAVSCAYR